MGATNLCQSPLFLCYSPLPVNPIGEAEKVGGTLKKYGLKSVKLEALLFLSKQHFVHPFTQKRFFGAKVEAADVVDHFLKDLRPKLIMFLLFCWCMHFFLQNIW